LILLLKKYNQNNISIAGIKGSKELKGGTLPLQLANNRAVHCQFMLFSYFARKIFGGHVHVLPQG